MESIQKRTGKKCACDILLSSFKTEILSTSIYSIIFNIADERLNLGKFDFNI